MITAALAGLIVLMLIALPFIIDALADRNFFFTKVRERTAVEVMAGEQFSRFILSYKGHVLTRNADGRLSEVTLIKDLDPVHKLSVWLNPAHWLARIGIYWVGIPAFYKIGWYKFKWAEPQPKDGGIIRVQRNEDTKYLYVNRFTYFPGIENAFTNENVPIDLGYLMVVQIEDLYKAHYGMEDWYVYVTGEINAAGRNYIGDKNFKDLLSESERKSVGDDSQRKLMSVITPDLVNEIRDKSGVRVHDVKVETVRLSDAKQHEDLQRALGAEFVAQQEGKADVARAVGRATAADSEVQRINKVYGAIETHPHGVQIRQMEAFERSGERGNGTNWVIGSSVGEMISSALRPSVPPAPTSPPTIDGETHG